MKLVFIGDRNQLFTAWNALANLADLAEKVDVTVRATSDDGFDENKLEIGVLEPEGGEVDRLVYQPVAAKQQFH